ncbi:MAG TPA: SPOR domain-containing protein [Terriglobales bacterium]
MVEEELSEDTEITLGTGKMLFLFFALVALCAVFFGMGFKVGRNSVKGADLSPTVMANVTGSSQSSTTKPSANPDMTFYKAVGQNSPDPQLSAANTSQPASATPSSSSSAPTTAPQATTAPANPADSLTNANGYLVQVAAVTKQEDADALVDALKKKQYPAFASANAVDKLVHVQVGPFSDIKQAEDTRTKLMNDGYNPILKK